MSTFRSLLRKESGPQYQSPGRSPHDRQRVLEILLDRSAPIPERQLAAALAGSAGEDSVEDASRAAHVELRHVHLPKLAEAGHITWDEADAAVTAVDRRASDEPSVDAVTDERRRTVLDVLSTRDGPQERAALAREVAAHEADEPSTETVDEVEARLHHVHLPKLERAGLVEYDADDGLVSHC